MSKLSKLFTHFHNNHFLSRRFDNVGIVFLIKCSRGFSFNTAVCMEMAFDSINPILHGGHKVPALISNIRIFVANTATATKFGDISKNLSGKTMLC